MRGKTSRIALVWAVSVLTFAIAALPGTANAGLQEPSIDIEKSTNGADADAAPGPNIAVGDPITWSYLVTNTGGHSLFVITVADDQGLAVACPATALDPGQDMTCTATGVAVAGQYTNVGTVTAVVPELGEVSDSDPSNYFGVTSGIEIEKSTNGDDADAAPGPSIEVGDPVNWAYVVTNTGNTELFGVTVTDDQGATVTCPQDTLAVAESLTCTAAGVAIEGPYTNVGSVEGFGPFENLVADDDPSNYLGVITPPPTPVPSPTAVPEPTPTAVPEPTPTAVPEPTPTALPDPTPTAVPPTPVPTPAGPQLAKTGSNTGPGLLIAFGLIAAGAFAVYGARRQRAKQA